MQPLEIGAHSYIRSGVVGAVSHIGRYVSIGQDVSLGLLKREHPIRWISTSNDYYKGYVPDFSYVKIGNDVWIGSRVIVFDGVVIGHGAIIAAGAIVTKHVGYFDIVAGNPAKKIGGKIFHRVS